MKSITKYILNVEFLSIFLLLIWSVYLVVPNINALPPNDDGADNLALSVGLAHYDTIGKIYFPEWKETFKVSNSREPMSNFLNEQWFKFKPDFVI